MNNNRKGKTKNQKRINGKFAKATPETIPVLVTDNDFINQVRNELFAGYFYPDKIKKAYHLITGSETGNMLLMRRTIISYNNN